jgi:hypothetical protein
MGHGATFGLSPAISGVRAAGMDSLPPEVQDAIKKHGHEPVLGSLIAGLGRLGYEHLIAPALGIKTEGGATAAYDKARAASQAELDAGQEQHPIASFAGELAGAAAVPVPGLAAAAAPARIARGATAGGVGGALYGAGSGLSKGESGGDIAKDAAISGGLGIVTGGVLGGVLGPRAINPTSRGQRSARYADEQLGAPIPRGLASDNPVLNATTSKIRSVPVIGSRVSSAVDATQHAAGERIGDIAGNMAGGATDRAIADAMVRPGLRQVIHDNRTQIDAAYDLVRAQIDTNRRFVMPQTQRELTRIVGARRAAGWPNPNLGLEQFENVSRGATFDGAHRARVDARDAGNGRDPHPGYNAAEFNRLASAMGRDIRGIVATAARGNPQRAVGDFNQAEREFGQLSEQNDVLHRLANSQGEGSIAKLLGAAREKSGNLQLLAQLRRNMPAADFQNIGGTLLDEMGHNNSTGEFSLAKFATEWDKISDGAKRVLFSPQHLHDIEEVANLGSHIKSALRESNTSHTAGVLILFDLTRDAILLGATAAAGTMSGATVASAALATPGIIFSRWLSNPATASSMARWTRARIGLLGHPTPARLAVFNIATRNLANNLGLPVAQVMKRLAGPNAGRPEEDQPK